MSPATDLAVFAELSAKIRKLEHAAQTIGPRRPVGFSLGIEPIDQTLASSGFPFAGLHEVLGQTGEADFAAANAFTAVIAARLSGGVLWCVGRSQLYAPAISAIGLGVNKINFFYAMNDDMALSAMEEGLRHPSLGVVVGEVNRLSLNQSRRLILASEKSGVPVFVLRPPIAKKRTEHVACGTRWRVTTAPSLPLRTAWVGHPRWFLELLRCRGSRSGQWFVEATDASGHLRLSQAVASGTEVAPFNSQQRRAAG